MPSMPKPVLMALAVRKQSIRRLVRAVTVESRCGAVV